MAEAAESAAWDHTASIIATVVGLVDKKATVEKYHPYLKKTSKRRGSVPLNKESLQALKKRFPEQWRPTS